MHRPTDHDDPAFDRLRLRSDTRERERAEDSRVANAAQTAVDRRVGGWLLLIAFVALVHWHGWTGAAIWMLAFVAVVSIDHWVRERTPGANGDAAERIAEDYARHTILADLHKRGDLRWEVKDGKVVAADQPEWDRFWTLTESAIGEFEQATPRHRRKRLEAAMKLSLPARLEMVAFAAMHKAKPCWWAVPQKGEPLA